MEEYSGIKNAKYIKGLYHDAAFKDCNKKSILSNHIKKIQYYNPWKEDKGFMVLCSDTNVLVEERDLFIRGNEEGIISIFFKPVEVETNKEIFIYINDESNKTEDCLLLNVRYTN